MGVRMTANHRTETQIEGELATFKKTIDVVKRSPTHFVTELLDQPFNMRYIWTKYSGTHSDHANDQKLKHKLLGAIKEEQCELAFAEKHLYAMPEDQRDDILEKIEDSLVAAAGGEAAWDALGPAAQQKNREEITESMLKDLIHKLCLCWAIKNPVQAILLHVIQGAFFL